jgi:hypothetical protein
MGIELKFPPICGGPHEGINDGNIETFEGDVSYYIARECAQNTIDASVEEGKTVELQFDLNNVQINYLPCLENLRDILNSCKKFWPGEKKITKFTEEALNYLKQDKIPTLKISDYGTTGLTGDDFNKKERWYGLVRSKGVANKDTGAGGSFGIGKSAALAASALRTVYYFTKTSDNIAFQGVSRMVTHLDNSSTETQASGYIGFYDEKQQKYYSVRDKDEKVIPAHFLRDKIGTDIYIPAYKGIENWDSDLIVSVLNDFWCGIESEIIQFKIGNEIIDKTNIGNYIKEYTGINFLNADRFYRAYKDGKKYEIELPIIGKAKLYLKEEDDDRETKAVELMRKNLMVIDTWNFQFRKSFSGVFICDNKQGNEILRTMEPPRHDKWDPARGDIKNGKKIIKSIKDWIKECAQKLMPLTESESFELSDIAKYLPDILDDDNIEELDKKGDNPPTESFITVPTQTEVTIPVFTTPPDILTQNDTDVVIDTIPTHSDGHGGNGSGGGRILKGGKGKTGLKARFIYNSNDNSYTIVLRSKQDFQGKIKIVSVGEDNETEQIYLKKAFDNSNEISISDNNSSIPINIANTETKRLKVFISQNEILSLRCIAYGD